MSSNCYNFSSQDVFLSDVNPSLITVINDNKLVIVYETIASIKIYDLTVISEQNKPIITIPLTESNVKQLIHSDFGNYLAIFADNQSSKTVRVYLNYWIEGQPIRVRPNSSLANKDVKQLVDYHSRESLAVEVIELKEMSIGTDCQHITCCQSNADLFVCCGYKVLLFSHQSYKLSNNLIKSDFILLLDVRLQWFATKLSSVDRYIAVMSKTHLSLLSLNFDYDQNLINGNNKTIDSNFDDFSDEENDSIEWDFDDYSKTIRLPSLFESGSASNQMMSHCHQVIGPVDQSLCCKFTLNMNHSIVESPICRASIDVLLCQYFDCEDPLIDAQTISYNRENSVSSDPLNALKPLKLISKDSEDKESTEEKSCLIGSALLFVTKNNIFYYNIFKRIQLKEKFNISDKIKSYSVNPIDDCLHLVTEKGLKTYALNYLQTFLKYKTFLPVFGLNFRTFLNIEFTLNTRNYLLLVTETENSLRTVYSLRKPSVKQIYCDINAILSDNQLENDHKYNLMSYLNSVLNFNCNLNVDTDSEVNQYYHKSCVDLCNFLFDSGSVESQEFCHHLINWAKLQFSHLINYKIKYQLIYDFIAKRLDSEQTFDVNNCDFSLLKDFLKSLSSEDFIMFCRFCLSQCLELDVIHVIIGLLEMFDSKDCHLPPITLSKLLLDKNDIESANYYMNSLQESTNLFTELCFNYRLVFHHKPFVRFFEKSVPNLFYKYLLCLVETRNSVEFVYNLLENDFEVNIKHNFLNQSYNRYRDLFNQKLILSLIEANVELLTNDSLINNLFYSPIESIERPSLKWIELLPPYHREEDCLCIECNAIVSDLYTLLYSVLNEDIIIKSHINNIITRIDVQNEWLFTARLLSMPAIEAIELVLNDFPLILSPFITDVCVSDTILLKKVIHLFDSKIRDIKDLDIDSDIGLALRYTLNQLAVSLWPQQFIEVLPKKWKDFAHTFVQKSIINMQSEVLREKIIDSVLQMKTTIT